MTGLALSGKRSSGAAEAARASHPSGANRVAREIGPSNQAQLATLRIGAANDPLEREADRIADAVLARGGLAGGEAARLTSSGPAIQRVSALDSPTEDDGVVGPSEDGGVVPPGEEQENGPTAMRKENAGSAEPARAAPRDVAHSIETRRGRGERLPATDLGFMERSFGVDLGGARMHADGEAADLAKAVNARAFTVGHDIYFGSGEYRPGLESGRRLIAHELAHVVQQSGSMTSASTLQRMTAPVRNIDENVHPWRDAISGTRQEVQTDSGSVVPGWRAYSPWKYEYHYWCHGLSLGTHAQFGYSVYSGPPMRQAINDEWNAVPAASAQVGDIAVWLPNYDHSAVFTSVTLQGGALDEAASHLDTKNGQAAEANMSLAAIRGVYPRGSPSVYRHK